MNAIDRYSDMASRRLAILLTSIVILLYMCYIYFIRHDMIGAVILGSTYFGLLSVLAVSDFIRSKNKLDEY